MNFFRILFHAYVLWLVLLGVLAITTISLAAGYQRPTLLPLIVKLEKTRDFVRNRVDPGAIERVALPPVHSHYMRGLTGTKHPQIVYNMRRLNLPSGGLRDTLYAILPDVTEEACYSYKKAGHGTGKPYVTSSQRIPLAKDRGTIVVDAVTLPAGISCIMTPDHHLMFTMALASRVKKPGSAVWENTN